MPVFAVRASCVLYRLLRRPQHWDANGRAIHADPRQFFKAEALVKRDVGGAGGFQIGGYTVAVGDFEAVFQELRSDTFAAPCRVNGDEAEVPVRVCRTIFFRLRQQFREIGGEGRTFVVFADMFDLVRAV